MKRAQAVEAILAPLRPEDVLVSTTGLISRQVFSSGDRPRNFYMLGSMGLASALALGLALLRPRDVVVVLEGDGSALMSLGALPLIASEAPANLRHVILDNGAYESTGGQPSIARTVSLADIAAASGYRHVRQASDVESLALALRDLAAVGPSLLVVKVELDGAVEPPPRVTLTPLQIRDRFAASLAVTP